MLFSYPDGATPLDPNETEGLILTHITTREELNRWEQENIMEAIDWLEKARPSDLLHEDFIRTVHKKMFGKVWTWAGKYRRSDKNIGVDWLRIPVELRKLVDDIRFWIDNKTYSPDEIAARFHHRLVQTHLFANGNGRHARIMADYLLRKKWNMQPFSWGQKNSTDREKMRFYYIEALRAADKNNYNPLLKFVRS
jgi:Fic-DOC domain mobile mystery protein B